MLRFFCECGQQLEVPDDHAGKKARCPKCGAVTVAPTEPDPEAPAPGERIRTEPPDPEEAGPITKKRKLRSWEDEEERAAGRKTGTSGKATASMILGLMSVLCLGNFLTGLPGMILGTMALGDIGAGKASGGRGMAITGIVTSLLGMVIVLPVLLVIGLLVPAVQKVRESAAKFETMNNLKQLVIAMDAHASARNNCFPAAALRSPEGKPLLSWRVAVLPYLGENALYSRFHLNEPWDSPHNSTLVPLMPKVYSLAGKDPSDGLTYFQVFVGPQTPFRGDVGPRMPLSFPDGTSNTILIAEAANAVPWTKPEDLPFTAAGPLPPLGGHFPGGFLCALADGSVRQVRPSTSTQTIKWAIIPDDGMVLPPDW
jgi:hypothetical protein